MCRQGRYGRHRCEPSVGVSRAREDGAGEDADSLGEDGAVRLPAVHSAHGDDVGEDNASASCWSG